MTYIVDVIPKKFILLVQSVRCQAVTVHMQLAKCMIVLYVQ